MASNSRIYNHVVQPIMLLLVITAGLVSMLGTGSNTFITVTTACTGPHQYVRTGSLVTLDGRCSDFTEAAPDNAHMLYEWSVKSRPQGSNAIVGNASNSVLASFVADIDGEYEIELATMIGGFSEVAKVTTRVTATTGNARPMVEAGPYQEVAIGDTVQLQATASDADDNPLSYSWSFQPGSEAAVLSDATSPDPTFVANDSGDYLVDVVVNDGAVDSLSDTVLIRSRDANFTLPVAVAGADQFALTGSQVNLNGINSYSPYDRPLTYRWRMISRPFGSVTGLSDKTTAQPSFIADKPGAYLIKLVVSDGAVDNSRSLDDVYEDRLIVIVGDNQPPVANGGEDHAVSTGTSATLDGVASSDPELATLTYSWTLIKQPDNSTASLSSLDSQSTQLTPDRDGDYLVRLVVNDGTDDSAPDIVRVSASSISGVASLTLVNGLPYVPPTVEVPTRIQIDTDDSDTIRVTSPNDEPPGSFETALEVTYSSATEANFTTGPGWAIISPADLTIADSTTPTFIVQRSSDSIYYKIVLDFTSQSGPFTVQIDALQAWRCGTDPADCP